MIQRLTRLIRPYTLVQWAVAAVHAVQGLALVVTPAAVGVTSITHILNTAPVSPLALGILYLVVSALSTVGLLDTAPKFWRSVALWLPQQVLVAWGGVGSIQAMIDSRYLDGTQVPQAHIVADQAVYPILALIHIIAFVLWMKREHSSQLDQKEIERILDGQ